MTDPNLSRRRETRIDELTNYLLAQVSATSQELADHFGVSVMTMHRDLDELERRGLVRKFRGGVSTQPSGVFESNVRYRQKAMLAQKQAVAAKARELIEPGMSVMLDDSTSALELARLFKGITPLRVVTNYLEGLKLLATIPEIDVTALGGDYDPNHDSFLGVGCVEAIEALRVDAVFVSTSAVSGAEAYHQEQHIVAVKRAMLKVAERRYLLLDHSKLGKVALHRLVPLGTFDLVIVDGELDEERLAELKENRVRFEVAEQ
jgi:DeoR/GlpR family transcriptional regulator of sugar metabolism